MEIHLKEVLMKSYKQSNIVLFHIVPCIDSSLVFIYFSLIKHICSATFMIC